MKNLMFATAALAALAASPALAQSMPDMPGMTHDEPEAAAPQPDQAPADPHAGHDMSGMQMQGQEMSGHDMSAHRMSGEGVAGMDMGGMKGALGPYSMMRDSSGTAWQPDSTPMEGVHGQIGQWSTMVHGYVLGVYDHQGGPRGDDEAFSESMLMLMAQRPAGAGTLTLRTMLSLDPLMGKDGYPLLLQTGETANGADPLIDRQHPHDLFMELSGTYAVPLDGKTSAFLYAGYPGEPALGPPTFMHRLSGMDNPEAPIGHHWLDSTHITFGVLTAGVVRGNWKLEGSVFNGREPDEHRWGFDKPRLDSASARLSWNPTENWAAQVSYGSIKAPEQLEPGVNQHRTTASVSYNRPLAHGNWQTTLAWGRNDFQPGPSIDAWLLESAVNWNRHTVFARAERDQKNELFEAPSPLEGEVFNVGKLSVGYIYDIPVAEHLSLGLGALGSVYDLPPRIEPFYGSSPASWMGFVRLKIR
jgi:hypothetical protein